MPTTTLPMMQTEPTLPAGTRLAHYELRDVLGSGAMGTVYRAHDTSLDRFVAVKVLRSRLADDPVVVDRFVREARAAARANHPNLTHVYFVGEEGGNRFFAMEYVPGSTLEQEVAAHGPMGLVRFVDIISQAARGLAAAHAVGVVHRDVKPSNMMLLPDGTVKVTDFGLAKSLAGDVAASGAGTLLGTPTFMSPEQCRGRGIDGRTDVYALGLTAWFLLAGRPPYRAESLGQMLNDQMNTPLPSIAKLRPDLPLGLDDALGKLCAKEPEARPQTMEDVGALVESFRPRPIENSTLTARATAVALDITSALIAVLCVAGIAYAARHLLGFSLVTTYLFWLSFAGALFASQFGMEAFFGTTAGKWLFNLEVVRADGARPTRTALAMRFLLRFPFVVAMVVPGDSVIVVGTFGVLQALASAGAVVSYLTANGLTLSDRITGTRVVYRRASV